MCAPVRVGVHSLNPPSTRLVIDLDHALPHTVRNEGSRIILVLTLPAGSGARRGAPSAAASGKIPGIFRRHSDSELPTLSDNAPAPVPPAPVSGGTNSNGQIAEVPQSPRRAHRVHGRVPHIPTWAAFSKVRFSQVWDLRGAAMCRRREAALPLISPQRTQRMQPVQQARRRFRRQP